MGSQIYNVSATNDGMLFGNSLRIGVFNGLCLDCDGGVCKAKKETCTIDNKCYNDGDHASHDSQLVCDITKSIVSWSQVKTSTSNLSIQPKLSGPDNDHLLWCKFFPPSRRVQSDYKVTWLVNDVRVKTEVLTDGET